MVRHFIITSSSYTEGTRIALDNSFEKQVDTDLMRSYIEQIRNRCGDDVSIAYYLRKKV